MSVTLSVVTYFSSESDRAELVVLLLARFSTAMASARLETLRASPAWQVIQYLPGVTAF